MKILKGVYVMNEQEALREAITEILNETNDTELLGLIYKILLEDRLYTKSHPDS